MTFEEEKTESAKLGMILDYAIEKPRGYILLYQRDSGQLGIISGGTPPAMAIQILRLAADIIEHGGPPIEFNGTRQYPSNEHGTGKEQRVEAASFSTAD